MRMNTFYQICIYITVVMILFTLSVNFVSAMNVFPVSTDTGIITGETTNETMAEFTRSEEYSDGFLMDNLWAVVLTGIAGGMVVALITHSTSIIGVYIFCFTFWSSYGNVLSMLQSNNFLSDMWGFVMIATVGMSFIFVGAVAGMLSGSG